jgi:hypothetical protein
MAGEDEPKGVVVYFQRSSIRLISKIEFQASRL